MASRAAILLLLLAAGCRSLPLDGYPTVSVESFVGGPLAEGDIARAVASALDLNEVFDRVLREVPVDPPPGTVVRLQGFLEVDPELAEVWWLHARMVDAADGRPLLRTSSATDEWQMSGPGSRLPFLVQQLVWQISEAKSDKPTDRH